MTQPVMRKILIIDDDPGIQTIIKFCLQSTGRYIYDSCLSGQEALTKAASFNPDLILLDVMMPDMNGPMTLQKLREIPALITTPVMYLSAHVQPHEVQAYMHSGVIGVLTKPITPSTFVGSLEQLWGESAPVTAV